MLPDLAPLQWAVLAGAIALVIVPRLVGVLKTRLGSLAGLLRRQPAAPDVHAKVDAYRTLVPDLSPELAAGVWVAIQSPIPPAPAGGGGL